MLLPLFICIKILWTCKLNPNLGYLFPFSYSTASKIKEQQRRLTTPVVSLCVITPHEWVLTLHTHTQESVLMNSLCKSEWHELETSVVWRRPNQHNFSLLLKQQHSYTLGEVWNKNRMNWKMRLLNGFES